MATTCIFNQRGGLVRATATGLQIPLMNNSTPIIGDSVTYVPLFHPFSVELSFSILAATHSLCSSLGLRPWSVSGKARTHPLINNVRGPAPTESSAP